MTSSPIREGQTLVGKYVLERLLGVGSMGEVYRAKNVAVGRVVAVKLLRKEHASNEQVVARFLREAKAANMVQHRNVAQVLDVGQDADGVPFIVQEFLEGRDLSDMLLEFEFGMPVQLALNLFLPITQAMAAVHAVGLVHRDLKPENVMLAHVDGLTVPKVLDFGVSKMEQGAGDARLTGVNTIMGSPNYMCPEQIQKPQTVDARADVWALGVMLYEALSAQLPFDSPNLSTLFVKICSGSFTPLDEVAHGLPQSVIDVVHRCLRVDREERFVDATALARALTQAAGRSQESVQQLRGGALDLPASPEAAARPVSNASTPAAVAATVMAPMATLAVPRAAENRAQPERPQALPTVALSKPVSPSPSMASLPPSSAAVKSRAPVQKTKSRVPVWLVLLAATVVLAVVVLKLLVAVAP